MHGERNSSVLAKLEAVGRWRAEDRISLRLRFRMTTSDASYAPGVCMARQAPRTLTLEGRDVALRKIRRVGLVVIGVQLIVLLIWSAVEAAHAVQSGDFVGFYQSWHEISHGLLSASGWWQQQAVFIQWPLAILGLVWPHPVTLLAVQDLAIVGAEAVAYLWICEVVAQHASLPLRAYCLVGLALLVLNPWIYWTASWDYHSEPLGTLFAILAARELFRGRRRAAIWCVLTLLCGLVPSTYLVGIGLGLLLRRGRRIVGCAVGAAGLTWFVVLSELGAGKTLGVGGGQAVGPQSTSAARIADVMTGVTTLVHTLAHHWLNLFANLLPSGLVGVFTAPVAGIATVTFGENYAIGNPNSAIPSFQSFPLYIFVPIGTVVALIWLHRRFGPYVGHALAALMVVNVVAWAAVWLPQTVPTWLRVSTSQAAAIKHLVAVIPKRDAVMVSQGIVGDFANRASTVHMFITLRHPQSFGVDPPYTWFVVAPYAGIETAAVSQSAQLISALAHDPRARLEYIRAGIWAFRLRVPGRTPHDRSIMVVDRQRLSAALFETDGRAVRRGPIRSWYMVGSDRARGPILWGDYYREPVGRYAARVKLEGHGPATVQVWNDSTGIMLNQRKIMVSRTTTVPLSAVVTADDPTYSTTPLTGAGPFQIDPVSGLPGNNLEVKVFATSRRLLKVRWVSIAAAP